MERLMHGKYACVLAAALAAVPVAHAAEPPAGSPSPPVPDAALLEYLGSWEDGDEDWMVAARLRSARPADATPDAKRSAPEAAAAGERTP
jgi:hypothetical protein